MDTSIVQLIVIQRKNLKYKVMKKTIFAIMLLSSFLVNGQSLNSNANHIKDNYSIEYQSTIRKHAVEKWEENFSMVIYEINKQSKSLYELIEAFESSNTNIFFNAIKKWSIDGYEAKNVKVLKSISSISLKNLLKMNCNWSMVKYEYNKQSKAKSAY
jgi:hypothetical protein